MTTTSARLHRRGRPERVPRPGAAGSTRSSRSPRPAAGRRRRTAAAPRSSSSTLGSMSADRMQRRPPGRRGGDRAARDGVAFAVIAGPAPPSRCTRRPAAAVSAPQTRAEAKRAIDRLHASGGTAIGAWLHARRGCSPTGTGRHRARDPAHRRRERRAGRGLRAALDAVAGRFVCDCRGVGTDWKVAELRKIATAMLGSVDIVAEPADLAADFRAMMAAAMGKTSADVALRVWTPVNARCGSSSRSRRRRGPDRHAHRVGHRARRLPARLVGRGEPRLPRLRRACAPGAAGERDAGRGRVCVVAGDDGARPGRVLARVDRGHRAVHPDQPQVAHYTGQAELADAIQEGLAAQEPATSAPRRSSSAGPSSSPRDRQQGDRGAAGHGRRRRGRGDRHGAAASRRSSGRRDGAGHPLDQDRPGSRRGLSGGVAPARRGTRPAPTTTATSAAWP